MKDMLDLMGVTAIERVWPEIQRRTTELSEQIRKACRDLKEARDGAQELEELISEIQEITRNELGVG